MIKKIILFLLILFTFTNISYSSWWKYSYEKSEHLMDKINWKEYSSETILEAKKQNKPIFLLLSAPSWCYWCQVYESEEYLFNPDVIKYLNENFITIFVDADKRQDLTRQYLEWGWPSTTVFTPYMERIYGFSWVRPVENMIENFERATVFVDSNTQSKQVINKLDYTRSKIIIPKIETIKSYYYFYKTNIERGFDSQYGWFWNWQKFPRARTLEYLIDEYKKTWNKSYLSKVNLTLSNHFTDINNIKSNYNIFDPIEWGFHRYWTTRKWSPPHYEKMLYDNAKLLKTYYKLLEVEPENKKAKIVVKKTIEFMSNNFIDSEKWWFYSDTSAYLEEEYYWLEDRSQYKKPRVEKTKYTPWNSEALLTYLYIYENLKNQNTLQIDLKNTVGYADLHTLQLKFKNILEKTLTFYWSDMISEEWAYHFYSESWNKWVTWNLLDNAYLLLAFTKAYEVLLNEQYLEKANFLASYSINNLYDHNSWWFFERNSKEKSLYLDWEEIILTKPFEENSIISYALLTLYNKTQNIEYLNAWIKTIWQIQGNSMPLDEWYYFIKTLQLLESWLLEKYNYLTDEIKPIEKKNNNFWLNNLLKKQNSNTVGYADLRTLQNIQNQKPTTKNNNSKPTFIEKKQTINFNFYLFLIISFIAGFLSFISPCTLPILPVFIANLFTNSKKNIFVSAILFLLWLNITFAILWVISAIFWSLINTYLWNISQIVWIILMLLWIFILAWKWFKWFNLPKLKYSSYFWSFLLWIFLAIAWTPCDWPILVSILTLAWTSWNIITSAILLLFYGLGLSIPLILVSLYIHKYWKKGKILNILKWRELKIKNFSIHITKLISWLIFIIIWYLIFSWLLTEINRVFSAFNLQQYLSLLEEKLMNFLK